MRNGVDAGRGALQGGHQLKNQKENGAYGVNGALRLGKVCNYKPYKNGH